MLRQVGFAVAVASVAVSGIPSIVREAKKLKPSLHLVEISSDGEVVTKTSDDTDNSKKLSNELAGHFDTSPPVDCPWGAKCIKERSDLPTFEADDSATFFYQEEPLFGAKVMDLMKQYHAGIFMNVSRANGTNEEYHFELFGDMMPSMIPKIKNNETVSWAGAWAVNTLYNNTNEKKTLEKVATLKGGEFLNELMTQIVNAGNSASARQYNMFALWPGLDASAEIRRNNLDNVCDKFAERIIWLLGDLGAEFVKNRKVLRRNYGVLLYSGEPEIIKVTDASGMKDVLDFYKWLQNQNPLLKLRDPTCHIRTCNWYLPDPSKDAYIKVAYTKATGVYGDMPMPPRFYEQCNKDVFKKCAWWPCISGTCKNGKCVCGSESCAYESKWGHYCKGP